MDTLTFNKMSHILDKGPYELNDNNTVYVVL